jgi:hypothetical protein
VHKKGNIRLSLEARGQARISLALAIVAVGFYNNAGGITLGRSAPAKNSLHWQNLPFALSHNQFENVLSVTRKRHLCNFIPSRLTPYADVDSELLLREQLSLHPFCF